MKITRRQLRRIIKEAYGYPPPGMTAGEFLWAETAKLIFESGLDTDGANLFNIQHRRGNALLIAAELEAIGAGEIRPDKYGGEAFYSKPDFNFVYGQTPKYRRTNF